MSFNDLIQGLAVQSIAFERGLLLRKDEHGWSTRANTSSGRVQVRLDEVSTHLRPVLLNYQASPKSPILPLLVGTDGVLAPRFAPHPLIGRHLYEGSAIDYLAGALIYHIECMHARYAAIIDTFVDILRIRGASIGSPAMFQGHPQPYYEFEALLSAARRAYDSCRYVLWRSFGPGKGSLPSSFARTLPHCRRLDAATARALENSWNTWGKLITEYRDCIHHYVPVDFGLSNIDMRQWFPEIWLAWARIPDNPQARTKKAFTYDQGLDALTFGWQAANEVLSVLRIVVDAVVRDEDAYQASAHEQSGDAHQ